MELIRKKIRDMDLADYNPRIMLKPGDFMYEKLRDGVEKYGLVVPVIWNRKTNRVVSGHQRLNILKDAGQEEVDVSVVELDEMAEKQLVIALNKIEGGWDEEKLTDIMKELSDYGEVGGFTEAEIAVITRDIEDIADMSRVREELEGNEEDFGITIMFDTADRDDVMFYLNEYGKEPLAREVMRVIRGEDE